MKILNKKGFTLIELLVVISIMALLSSIVMSGLSSARSKARDSKRIQDTVQIRTALELYRTSNNTYPATFPSTQATPSFSTGGGDWHGNCSFFGGYPTTGVTGYIPNLAPTYISVLPLDPKPIDTSTCYVYTSNGIDYMFIVYKTVEGTVPASLVRPNYATTEKNNYTIYTPGASAW
jgi:prepilin-type N-terminal cleavage/methylation domain-containing protein